MFWIRSGLGDRALLAALPYTFARISAVVGLRVSTKSDRTFCANLLGQKALRRLLRV
jgi:hypothetical protein